MTDLPEKIYQDGSTGQYRVTCEYCDKDFLGHKMDTTCTQCGEMGHTVGFYGKWGELSCSSLQKKLCESPPDSLISGGTRGGSMTSTSFSFGYDGEEL